MNRDHAMTITLTPEIEQALLRAARELGTTPEQLALDSLRDRFLPPLPNGPLDDGQGSLADFLGEFIGVLNSGEHIPGGARLSVDSHRTFADLLRERRRRRE